jgi:hypothetical protein
MKVKNVLKSAWRIFKPVVTLGLSVVISQLSNKAGSNKAIVQSTAETVKDKMIEEIDEAVEGKHNKQISKDELNK